MSCYHPKTFTPAGRREITMPCGQCIGCRIDYSRMWAMRCAHELQFHKDSCVVTLTYDDKHLPPGGTLVKKDFQDFLLRLRNRCRYKLKNKRWVYTRIAYFACGEYGDALGRPHYHAILYGCDFPDKRLHKKAKDGSSLFTSEALEALWGKGNCLIGAVTYTSAAYVARYIMKKVMVHKDGRHELHYQGKAQEFSCMSTRPAIGKQWFDKYHSDAFPADEIIYEGKKHPVPRYYDKLLKRKESETIKTVKQKRFKNGLTKQNFRNSRPDRLAVREEVKKSQITTLKRALT